MTMPRAMVVKWSAWSPSTLTIQVLIPLLSTIFTVSKLIERNEKEAENGLQFNDNAWQKKVKITLVI